MGKIKIFYDQKGNTLTVWFEDAKKEYIAEEAEDEVVLMKDKGGKVIGFEKLNYLPPKVGHPSRLPVEVIASEF